MPLPVLPPPIRALQLESIFDPVLFAIEFFLSASITSPTRALQFGKVFRSSDGPASDVANAFTWKSQRENHHSLDHRSSHGTQHCGMDSNLLFHFDVCSGLNFCFGSCGLGSLRCSLMHVLSLFLCRSVIKTLEIFIRLDNRNSICSLPACKIKYDTLC